MLDLAAGDVPEAYLVHGGGRHRLRAECTIGRAADADIALVSAGVSRRHAEIYALEGEFWASDLGSTNPTFVNGCPLGPSPVKLADGDRIVVGDVELVYEEKPRKGS
jgi:pSer/pThr/pTyr-binding forkhead associated (FHA) protein